MDLEDLLLLQLLRLEALEDSVEVLRLQPPLLLLEDLEAQLLLLLPLVLEVALLLLLLLVVAVLLLLLPLMPLEHSVAVLLQQLVDLEGSSSSINVFVNWYTLHVVSLKCFNVLRNK